MRPGCQQGSRRLGSTVRARAQHLQDLRRSELRGLYDAAAKAIECAAALADAGKNPVTEVLGGAREVEEWAHFPAGDVIDPDTQSRFYYHAHALKERAAGEHGHFHTFVHADSTHADAVTHLIGISADASGRLIRLFTTNRWVTGEVWQEADSAIRLLDRFDITVAAPSRELNRWISAIVRLFRPQIVDLIRARDTTIAQWRAAHPGRDVFEDRELQVTSEMPVDFLAQVSAVEAALART